MKSRLSWLFQLVAFITLASFAWAASPCLGVNRNITPESKKAVASIIAQQLGVKSVDVLDRFQEGAWSIFYVDTHEADEVYLVYAHAPSSSKYVTRWSGAARMDEEQGIKGWIVQHAPGIPHRLAACFAWHVTHGRPQNAAATFRR